MTYSNSIQQNYTGQGSYYEYLCNTCSIQDIISGNNLESNWFTNNSSNNGSSFSLNSNTGDFSGGS